MSKVDATVANLMAAAENRCSCYILTNTCPIPDSRVEEIVKAAVKHCPSSFNVQSARAVILFKSDHEKLWDIADRYLKQNMPAQAYEMLAPRVVGFRGGYGSVLWLEDQDALAAMGEKQPAIKGMLPECMSFPSPLSHSFRIPFLLTFSACTGSEHSSGMHQFFVWQALELEGLGCNLQHYNFMPDFEAEVKKQWNIPETWKLKSQLVFGEPKGGKLERRMERTYEPLDKRVFVHGS